MNLDASDSEPALERLRRLWRYLMSAEFRRLSQRERRAAVDTYVRGVEDLERLRQLLDGAGMRS
jgi:hypothetical protein